MLEQEVLVPYLCYISVGTVLVLVGCARSATSTIHSTPTPSIYQASTDYRLLVRALGTRVQPAGTAIADSYVLQVTRTRKYSRNAYEYKNRPVLAYQTPVDSSTWCLYIILTTTNAALPTVFYGHLACASEFLPLPYSRHTLLGTYR